MVHWSVKSCSNMVLLEDFTELKQCDNAEEFILKLLCPFHQTLTSLLSMQHRLHVCCSFWTTIPEVIDMKLTWGCEAWALHVIWATLLIFYPLQRINSILTWSEHSAIIQARIFEGLLRQWHFKSDISNFWNLQNAHIFFQLLKSSKCPQFFESNSSDNVYQFDSKSGNSDTGL